MNVIVQAQTLDLTAALHSFVRQQVARLASFSDKIDTVRVTVDKDIKSQKSGKMMIVKIHISLIRLPDIIIEQKAEDMYQAITEAVSRTIRQVRKAKEKVLHKHR